MDWRWQDTDFNWNAAMEPHTASFHGALKSGFESQILLSRIITASGWMKFNFLIQKDL